MSETDGPDREVYGGQSVDDEDQLQPEDTLIDRGSEDVLDEGFSPPERHPASHDRTTREEQRLGETIDDRLAQEEPDTLAGDLAVPAPGDPNRDRAGRLVAPDQGAHEDVEKDAVADDVGIDGGAASAEEAAVHIVGEDSVR
jgi:hypothetical protein